jgi:dipeptidyl aminopeptidase/acylaminoacyl peptidase
MDILHLPCPAEEVALQQADTIEHPRRRPVRRVAGSLIVILLVASGLAQAQEKRRLTFTDLMKFRQIEHLTISTDGQWVAFTAEPDRGDPEVIVRSTRNDTRHIVARGSHPAIAEGGGWVAMRLNPTLEEVETLEETDRPRSGAALLNTTSGEVATFDDVESFAFSGDGRWLAVHHFGPRETDGGAGPEDDETRKPGTGLALRELATGSDVAIDLVRGFAFDEDGRYVAYAVVDPEGGRDGLYVRDLAAGAAAEQEVHAGPSRGYSALAWSDIHNRLGFVTAPEDSTGKPGDAALWTWDGERGAGLLGAADAPDGWMIPLQNELRWTRDGDRLFFGFRPAEDGGRDATDDEPFDPYDTQAIVADREIDVWHWMDTRIKPQEKVEWERDQETLYAAVYHLDSGKAVQLADLELEAVGAPENDQAILGRARQPYQRSYTWDVRYFDSWVIDLETGGRTPIHERLVSSVTLSPEGRYVAYYKESDWYLFDVASATTRNVTADLGVPFADEDWDYPGPTPGYGIGGWEAGDAALLIYDKYDIWYVPTTTDGEPRNLTQGEGRATERIFRVIDTDPKELSFERGENLLLSSYHDKQKNFGFYGARLGRPGVNRLLEEDKRFSFEAKAENADVFVYTREDFDEFPDLWLTGSDFRDPRKLTNVNPQIAEFLWGSPELVEWTSADGTPMQGVVIKPEDYEPGRRYPVLVYFYRFFSQRMYEFNEPVVNHRPSFPMYTSNGYIVFLPDIRFEVGRPGLSATKSLVPGVQRLVDLGLADPDAIGLHGHSWSGYQTAFVITQTNIFAAAVAGAPVSNMTSAYSGIRWGSGLARQFQYEKTQSRLSGSLWEARDEYIDNSPVFFADRVQTPVVLMHGDEDGAVPWYQSIEFYLALRRNNKPSVFLQYRGEPHHPQKYPNKLDYSIKMMEFFDHFLKGAPAPKWWAHGVPYAGR